MMKRSAGILMPLFSLPNAYGIGSMGKEAREFADFLHDAGQSWWQVLPVGPTGEGNSPYSSESTFAGNLLYIDLEQLMEEALKMAARIAGNAPIAVRACKKAVKGGDALAEEEIRDLVTRMIDQRVTPTCPHGRPLVISLSHQELDKRFRRIQ